MSKQNLFPGIYEKIITHDVKEALALLSPAQIQTKGIDAAEGANILTSYLQRILARGLSDVAAQYPSSEKEQQLAAEIALTNKIGIVNSFV